MSRASLMNREGVEIGGRTTVGLAEYTDEILGSGFPGIRPLGERGQRIGIEDDMGAAGQCGISKRARLIADASARADEQHVLALISQEGAQFRSPVAHGQHHRCQMDGVDRCRFGAAGNGHETSADAQCAARSKTRRAGLMRWT